MMDGILIINKPKGITSHKVVNIIRRSINIKRVGHAGTLDPMATGVLVVLIGKATKLSNKFLNSDKVYIAEMTLGIITDTSDAEGRITQVNPVSCSSEHIRKVFSEFKGVLEQTPPMFSAKKIKGVPLYKLARKGVEIKRKPQKITIYELDINKIDKPIVNFRLKCSKGTYVRTICDDIGKKLGCGAHLSALTRIQAGKFSIERAVNLEQIKKQGANSSLIPLSFFV